MDSKVRARLKRELPGIYTRLLAKAELLIRRSGWRRRFDMNRKSVAEDLLHEAVLRSLTPGGRQWHPEKVDLWGFLVGAMKSIVNAAVRSPENATTSLNEPTADGSATKIDELEDEGPSAEEPIGHSKEVGEQVRAIFEAAGDDPILLKLVEVMMDGHEKPANIAKQMNVTADAVYQAQRKLRRRVEARKNKEGNQ